MLSPADIILTRSTGALSALNIVGQSAATLSRSRFTHVLVCVAPGTLVDALPKQGVQVRNVVHEVIAGRLTIAMCKAGYLKVLRPTKFAEEQDGDDVQAKMWTAFSTASEQLKKRYNKLFLVPNSSDARAKIAKDAFCSELVTLVLRPLDLLPKTFARPSGVLPVHFQSLESDPDWHDITSDIESWFATLEEWASSFNREDARSLAETMAQFNFSVQQLKAHRGFTDASAKLDAALESAFDFLRQVRKAREG